MILMRGVGRNSETFSSLRSSLSSFAPRSFSPVSIDSYVDERPAVEVLDDVLDALEDAPGDAGEDVALAAALGGGGHFLEHLDHGDDEGAEGDGAEGGGGGAAVASGDDIGAGGVVPPGGDGSGGGDVAERGERSDELVYNVLNASYKYRSTPSSLSDELNEFI